MCYSKIIVAAVIALNMIFTAAVLIIFWKTSSEPTALIAAFFAFTTGELWAMASIKKCKQKADVEKEKNKGEVKDD